MSGKRLKAVIATVLLAAVLFGHSPTLAAAPIVPMAMCSSTACGC